MKNHTHTHTLLGVGGIKGFGLCHLRNPERLSWVFFFFLSLLFLSELASNKLFATHSHLFKAPGALWSMAETLRTRSDTGGKTRGATCGERKTDLVKNV